MSTSEKSGEKRRWEEWKLWDIEVSSFVRLRRCFRVGSRMPGIGGTGKWCGGGGGVGAGG